MVKFAAVLLILWLLAPLFAIVLAAYGFSLAH